MPAADREGMMIHTKTLAIALLALGAAACGRRTTETVPTSETNTTSGPVNRNDTAGATTTTGAGSDTTGTTPTAAPYDDSANRAAGGPMDTGSQRGDVSGTTTITGEDTQRIEADTIAADKDKKDGGALDRSAKGMSKTTPSAKGKQGDNKSTPLGDGTSGEYTGGKGTYGGKATHGTGVPADDKK